MKQLLIRTCLLLSLNRLVGQTNRIDLGIEGGSGPIYLRGSAIVGNYHKPAIGFCGGFFLQFNFKRIISVRTTISGERKGSTATMMLTDPYGIPIKELKIKTDLYYVTLPVLLRATFGKKCSFFLNGGPYIGYLIKQPTVEALSVTFGNTSPFKKFDFGITTGLGFTIPVNPKTALSFEARHNLGLYNVAPVSYPNDKNIKTNSAHLLLSFTRKLGFRNKLNIE